MNPEQRKRSSHRMRKIKASLRDTFLLLREFAWPLVFFMLAIVGGGALYHQLSIDAGEPSGGLVASIYQVLAMTFLQPVGAFPDVLSLQIFHFVMPVAGIGILAQGLADFGFLFFNRQARGKEWAMAVASTMNRHVVLIGLGHLGFRVAGELNGLGQEVVVIENNPKADLIAVTHQMDIPIIQDDGKRLEALQGAGVAKAETIVICTQDDSLNMKIAFRARKLNPEIRVVIRIFDDDFAQVLSEQFDFQAMSATGMAAPKFAAAAAGVDITRPITIEGEMLSLVRLNVHGRSRLIGCSVAEIEQAYDVSVVLLRQDHASDFHPSGDRTLTEDDVLAVLAGPSQISKLVNDMGHL